MVSVYSPSRSPVSALSRSLMLLAALVLLMATLPIALPLPHAAVENGAGIPPQFDALPLHFVPNVGQTDTAVLMETRSPEGTVSFLTQEVAFSLPHADNPVRLRFEGANATPQIIGADPLPGRINDLRGDDPAQWHTDIPTYAGIVYDDLYAGIDLRYDGAEGMLKGTYTVAPGADPAQIRWRYTGASGVAIDAVRGDLRVTVAADHTLTEAAPVAWQDIAGQRVTVEARYAVAADGTISFVLGAYNAAYPLIIDPAIAWSTYLGGGTYDELTAVAIDAAGNVYVTGTSLSIDFPTANPFQATNPGDGTACHSSMPVPCQDVVITKISADGRTLVYSTYLGGVGNDVGAAIAVDAAGNAYIAGITGSTDFPTYQPFQGRCAIDPEGTCRDGFVVKLNAHGSALSYSTYLGGVLEEGPEGIAVDGVGQAVVVGYTTSTNFPQRNPLPGAPRGANAFVTKFAADGRSLVFSTLIGGNRGDYARGLAVDAAGNSYLAGFTQSTDFPTKNAVQRQCAVDALGDCMDAFVAKLGADGRALVYSTYLGGGELDAAYGVAVDQNGQVVVTGNTASPTFPLRNALQRTKRGLFDAFVTKLTPTGNAFVYSTYLGGSEFEEAMAVAVDSTGTAYLAGMTSSTDFPVVNAVQPKNAGGACVIDGETFPCSDTFVTTLTPDGATLGFSTYLGGRGLEGDGLWIERAQGIAVDQQGNAYVAGYTTATDFPARHALQRQCAMDVGEPCEDGFVTRISTRVSTPQAYLPFIKR